MFLFLQHAASQGNRGRDRPSRQASSVRQTRSRARAVPVDPDSDCAAPSVTVPPNSPPFVDTLPFQLVSFGRPPPQCDELQDFDTAPGLRAVVTDSALTRSTWERDMERRVVSSERMLGEIHNLVLNLRPKPAVAAPSTALGSAVQSVSVDMPPGEGRHAVPPVTAPAGHALPPFPDAPWPSVDTFFPGTAVPPLSEDTQTLLSSCNSTALPLDAQIPDVLRAKIMAGDYIDLSLLLKPSLIQPQEFALSIDRGASQPTVCVSPARPNDAVLSIDQWGRAFQLYMSVYLLQPANLPCAVKIHGGGEGVGRCGFSVGCIGLPPQVNTAAVTNLKSASEFPEVIDLKLSYGWVGCLGLLPCPSLLSLSGDTRWCRPEESCW